MRISETSIRRPVLASMISLALVLFGAIVVFLRDRAQLERLVLAIILPSLPIALYAVVQRFGQDPMPWLGNVTRRVASTMGNSIFVAAYLIMVVPLTWVRLVQAYRRLEEDESTAAVLPTTRTHDRSYWCSASAASRGRANASPVMRIVSAPCRSTARH